MNSAKVKIKNFTEKPAQWMKGLYHQKKLGEKIKFFTSHPTFFICLFIIIFSLNVVIGYVKDKKLNLIAIATPSDANNPIYVIPLGGSKEFQDKVIKKKTRVRVIRTKYYKGPQVLARPSSEVIPPGSMIKAKLISGASNGSVKAKSVESLTVNGEVIIPAGSVFWGAGNSNEHRLYVSFKKLVLKSGSVKAINAQAADGSDKVAGLKGSKLGNYGFRLAGSIGLNMLGGLSEGLREKEIKGGVSVDKTDLSNALLSGAAHASIELSRELMNGLKNKKPMILKKSGAYIYIIFEGD